MDEDEFYRIAELEQEHWWYKCLHNLVLAGINRHFDNKEIKIVDAGCGTGGLMSFLIKNGYKNIEGFDKSEIAIRLCKTKKLNVFEGDLKNIKNYYSNNDIDVIISNDTLYFLDKQEQIEAINSMYQLLKNNGVIMLNLPCLNAFRGIHDLKVGIKKRFSRKDTRDIIDSCEFHKEAEIYWPFLLSPFIWFSRYLQRLKMRFNKNTEIKSDLKKQNKIINALLFSIANSENKLFHKKPFGSSMFIVMRKNIK